MEVVEKTGSDHSSSNPRRWVVVRFSQDIVPALWVVVQRLVTIRGGSQTGEFSILAFLQRRPRAGSMAFASTTILDPCCEADMITFSITSESFLLQKRPALPNRQMPLSEPDFIIVHIWSLCIPK